MTVRTFDKDGSPGTCWRCVEKIKIMTFPRQGLLNLKMTFEDGTEIDYYLHEHERFAVIE